MDLAMKTAVRVGVVAPMRDSVHFAAYPGVPRMIRKSKMAGRDSSLPMRLQARWNEKPVD
jgi:hypothetical protein